MTVFKARNPHRMLRRRKLTDMVTSLGVTLSATLLMAGPASGQEQPNCKTDAYNSLDFKIGRFIGHAAEGQLAGISEVESILAGCAVSERWHGAISGDGLGIFYRKPNDEKWYLLYLNDDGQVLELSGPADANGMTLSGQSQFYKYVGLHLMRWQKDNAGAVRQIWHLSKDGGDNWERVADILLEPVPQQSQGQ